MARRAEETPSCISIIPLRRRETSGTFCDEHSPLSQCATQRCARGTLQKFWPLAAQYIVEEMAAGAVFDFDVPDVRIELRLARQLGLNRGVGRRLWITQHR